MTVYVGGLRARLIHDNIFDMVESGLQELGWIEANDSHRATIIQSSELDYDNVILEPNIVSVTSEEVMETEVELGSNLTDNTWTFYIDVYAEDFPTGIHLSADIRDMLNGKNTSLDRTGYSVEIYDLTKFSATPIVLFSVGIENIMVQRSRLREKSWQQHWWVIHFEIVDTYASDLD